jgi:hypothetical protein
MYEIDEGLVRDGQLLQSKSTREELAVFMNQRAFTWLESENWKQAAISGAWASSLAPQNVILEDSLRSKLNKWDRWIRAEQPEQFPSVRIKPPPRRIFPEGLAWEYEQQLLGMNAVEVMLLEPAWAPKWRRMKTPDWNGRSPSIAWVDYFADGSFEIRLQM